MSADNVTPIRPDAGPPKPPRRQRKAKRHFLHLTGSKDGENFTTLDILNGLRGVCRALDTAAVDSGCGDVDHVGDLAMAAAVLSEMVADRVEIP